METPVLTAFFKKDTTAQEFSCKFCELSKNTFLQNNSGGCILKKSVTNKNMNNKILH